MAAIIQIIAWQRHVALVCYVLLWYWTSMLWSIDIFTITAEIHARSLANFYCQYADRHMNLKFMRRVSEREPAIPQFVIVTQKLMSSLNVPLGFASRNTEVSGKQNSLFPLGPVIKCLLLYSWRFSRYSASFHWLVHGHMTSNNETVSRQMPWAGNIAKAMTSNGKQFTVDRCCTWWLESQLPSNLSVSLDFVSGNIEILGKQNLLFPSGPVIKCLLLQMTRTLNLTICSLLIPWSIFVSLMRTRFSWSSSLLNSFFITTFSALFPATRSLIHSFNNKGICRL